MAVHAAVEEGAGNGGSGACGYHVHGWVVAVDDYSRHVNNLMYRRNSLDSIMESLGEAASDLEFLHNGVQEEYDDEKSHWGESWARRMASDMYVLAEAIDAVQDVRHALGNRMSKEWYGDGR